MVQYAVAKDHVELFRLETRLEEIHLHETHAIEIVLTAEPFGQPQRIQAHVGADYAAAGDAEEIRQLTGSATHFQHPAVVGNRLVEDARILAATRLFDQRADRVVVVVIRKRRLFVEGLDHFRDVCRFGDRFVRPE